MEITVNQQPYVLNASCSVTELLCDVLRFSDSGIAVAVNQAVVSKADWPARFLQPGDQVMLIKATQGG